MKSCAQQGLVLLLGLSLLGGCHQQQTQTTPVFSFDQATLSEAKPWTSEDFNNNPDNFQFAVIGDRAGGADRRGIFERAMDQLNLLQPDFVINVGDLIEGYSKDEAKLTAEWDQIDSMLSKLEMPFFRTVGNHDLGNDTMEQVWLERHGRTYYHFVYGDVLFLVLNSEDPPRAAPEGIEEDIELYNRLQVEDPEKAKAMLDEFMATVASYLGKPANFSDQQVAYAEKTLAQNPDVRWTFVFLHEPAWKNPSENFLAIEQLLQGRSYTFLAGHLHYYDIEERFDRDYITMGPAGASFHKDGPGNVDHILWVTMTEDGPRIAQITLDGIYDRGGRDLEVKEMYDRERGEH
ncbi:MAG: metallophosphoesterase [Myxococcales bacterium]|nr:MAG: metallophosphoesterase [Myxococcales bacterium]